MSAESTSKPPAKRWRFQFSLRALMLAVLVYGGLWLLTLNVGGSALTQAYAKIYSDENVIVTNVYPEALIVGAKSKENDEAVRPWAFRGLVHSPALFVLIWEWEDNSASGSVGWGRVADSTVFYFWIPVRKITITKRPPVFTHIFAGY